jgi:FixJ family two-component response regulator
VPTRRSVFVVDDDPSMRMGIKRLPRVHGFHSTLFESANALLTHGDFDKAVCLIVDINLNGESGIELYRRLADSGVSLPVVYITGNDSEANHAGAIESGCIAYLTKPFAASSLIEPIERVHVAAA